ncbi:hypothetical protein K439DRAFT_1369380 [Ramaria rubella]|nr:hypothetical protein K439DRAFT_1369380 [Ramaria rubella]
MYHFCNTRGLREVWGYLWTAWYQPKMWVLWARSTSPYLPRWRTTMSVENFWHQLKHDYLHHLVWPCLDQLVWIIQTQVVPYYMARATFLEDVYRLGRPRCMMPFQMWLKKEWGQLSTLPLSGRAYATDVSQWSCVCEALKYNSFHLCKHLVQAVPPPPISFFREVVHRCTQPLYKHPAVHPRGEEDLPWADPEDRSITDGDDHLCLGDKSLLSNGAWRDILKDSMLALGKHRSSVISNASSALGDHTDGSSEGELRELALSKDEDEDEVCNIYLSVHTELIQGFRVIVRL